MLGLLALLSVGVVAGLFTDLFSLGSSEDVQETVSEITPETATSLLDEEAVDAIRLSLLDEIALTNAQGVVNTEFTFDPTLDYGEIEGTDGDDLIQTTENTEVTFGYEGDDTIVGTDRFLENFFGDEGDDQIFAEGGSDLVIGGSGDDLLVGGSGDDEIVGESGTDTLFGGDGDDSLLDNFSHSESEPPAGLEALNAGAGNDRVTIEDGLNLVELGEGEDTLTIYAGNSAPTGSPIAVVTDFDPAEDALVIGVHSDNPDLISEDIVSINFTMEQIETQLGIATMIIPAVEDETLAAQLADANVGIAVLQGVTPQDLADANIVVVLTDESSDLRGSEIL